MTIRLGSSTFNEQNDSLQIASPSGFNNANALRISNYTVDVLILQGITGVNPTDIQYLPPFTQLVYPIMDVKDYPTMKGLQLGPDIPSEQVLIEWSDNGEDDFLGTYPYALPNVSGTFPDAGYVVQLASDTLQSSSNAGTAVIVGDTFKLSGPGRLNATIVNNNPTDGTGNTIQYHPGAAAGATVPIPPGASLTVDNGATIFIDLVDPSTDAFSIFGSAQNAAV